MALPKKSDFMRYHTNKKGKIRWLTEVESLVRCYFCQSEKTTLTSYQRTIQFDGGKYRFARCRNCRGYSLFPKLSEAQLSFLYSSDYVGADEDESSSTEKAYEAKFADLAAYLASHRETPGEKFLDYGCGANPISFKMATENALIPYGMELTADVRAIAEQNTGIKLHSREEIIQGTELFDVIFLGDVLEHLIDPITELESLIKKLMAAGILIAQGPLQGASTLTHRLVGLFALLTQGRSANYPPYHVSLATLLSMKKLLAKCGLQITFIRTYEVDWPVPTFEELRLNLTPRNIVLFMSKQIDKIIAKIYKNYGTRYFVVCKKSQQ